MVGWSYLHSAVRQRLTAASGQGHGQWQKVLDLIEDRVGAGVPRVAPPLDNREWYLTGIQIEGFRGIGGTLRLYLDPTPGLTVVHAPNGSGKSSLAEAVLRALGGQGPEGGVPGGTARPRTVLRRAPERRCRARRTGQVRCRATPAGKALGY
ncbi:MAG: ATP-binding protein [Pseudonocardiaceae bacterium]